MTDPRTAICLTFDVDGESTWRLDADGTPSQRLSQISWGRFGIVRGLPRILGLLAELDVRGTFFVPGRTAELHPAEIRAIADAGHEVGHHGHDHLLPSEQSVEIQEIEIDAGLAALREVGVTPLGYRAPSWDVTPDTFALVVDRGFLYDSSFMGDDRPYREQDDGRSIVEVPVDWNLDDFVHFAVFRTFLGSQRDPADVFATWQTEIESAIAEQRPLVLTFHPEVVGRANVFVPFAAFVRRLHADPRIALTTCAEVARAFAASEGEAEGERASAPA
jgi:peptidoglycan/xylan/chitin deacetylase (PgdA/CDA1 family)